MGNSATKNNYHSNQKYTSQYSLSDIIGGSCIGTPQPARKQNKAWSRASCRSWSEGTLYDPLGSSKTLWPVSRSQAMFLPEFQIRQIPLQTAYTFVSIIAKGAYGKVYKIRKHDTGQLFALKVISKAKVVTENGVMQAKQEVSIQKLVGHHPFILDVNHRWQGRKTLYILTDYIGGGELFSLVEQYGSLPENVVRIYVAEVALAIDFLHNAGVVHRDIKATNVLLDDEGHAVIIDFGLAKWLSHTERTNTLCGTPEYMAPEIFNRQYYGQEVDWWSLGVLACFMLTNQVRFNGTITDFVSVQLVPLMMILSSVYVHLSYCRENTVIVPGIEAAKLVGPVVDALREKRGFAHGVISIRAGPLCSPFLRERKSSAGHFARRPTNIFVSYPAGTSSELLPEDRGTGYAPAGTLPPNAENVSAAAKDLLKRLLQPDPCLRLRSLLGLQRIAFYMGYDVRSYMQKTESPFQLLGRRVETEPEKVTREFSNFDSSLGDSVLHAEN